MATIIITIQDNPLAGQPDQPDYTMTVESNDPMPPVSVENAKRLTPAQMAAIASISNIADKSYEAAWAVIDPGSPQ
jgi:hypothetical protein